ncbi:heptosyltransferase I [Oceanospirillum multiglobuliferum]|nr:heptosyltransferase I [Oceanospirillum multiglobuliferum]
MRAIWSQLKHSRFDVLLHMQQALRGSLLSLGLKADLRLGYDKGRAKDWQWLFTDQQLAPRAQDHVLESFMDFPRALGVPLPEPLNPAELCWEIPIPEAAKQEAARHCDFSGLGLAGASSYWVLSPCSTQRARNFRSWTIEGYAELIDQFYEKYQQPCILTGGPTEQELAYAAGIMARVKSPVLDLVGKTSVKGLLAVIQNAQFVVAPDSGPVHIANAVGVPVIGIFATTNPRRAGPYLWRDYVVDCYPKALQQFMNKTSDEVKWGQRVRFEEAMAVVSTADVLQQIERLQADQKIRIEVMQ